MRRLPGAAVAALGRRYQVEFAGPAWLPEVISRHGLQVPPGQPREPGGGAPGRGIDGGVIMDGGGVPP